MRQKPQTDPNLITAGGSVVCARCTAKSKRTGEQCGRPALKVSKTQKCQFHGGRSTGPKTSAGRQRIASAHYKHGESSKEIRRAYSQASAQLRRIEESMYILGMTAAPRTRGRKPTGYTPVQSIHDVHIMILDMVLHPNAGSNEGIRFI